LSAQFHYLLFVLGMDIKTFYNIDASDALRSPETIGLPDPRMGTGAFATDRLTRQHQAISSLNLSGTVPESVRVHFETAKNLFLYSWCVYRFYMVAEQYALTTLEFALRAKLASAGLVKLDDDRLPGLKQMLNLAQRECLISDERFTPREDFAWKLASERHSIALSLKMEELGLHEMIYDPQDIKPSEEDLSIDWLSRIADRLPKIRNIHAHGTEMLYPTVLTTFVVVHNIIQQLFDVEISSSD